MTIRARMTLWYSAVLLVSALVIAGLSVDELSEQHSKEKEAGKGLDDLFGVVGWIGVPAILLSIGGGAWMMRKALAPVADLTRSAQGISEHNLSEQLPRTANGDELDRLAEVLNAMIARLNDSFRRIRDFTLHASHELKTPLTVLCGETEMELSDESLGAPARDRAASRLEELRRLARIVDGLTLLAKADAGLIALGQNPVSLHELVQDSFADTKVLAQSSGLVVELQTCEHAMVRGDAHRLRQLLLNLSDNAVKYNQPGGRISMGLHRANSSAIFTMANTGPGIRGEALPRVFDRFFRGDTAHGHEPDGCGLGLSIARWIVKAHQGTIRIDSVPFELTSVTICLPLLSDQKAACLPSES
ncbi:MAG TPA: ATP-binding protein [Verrucomicrobiae bacterium]|nr:ATP-binding protein [Verrucomicrobiae bacterium]